MVVRELEGRGDMLTDEKILELFKKHAVDIDLPRGEHELLLFGDQAEGFAHEIEKLAHAEIIKKIAESINDDCDGCLCIKDCLLPSAGDRKTCHDRIDEHIRALMLDGEQC